MLLLLLLLLLPVLLLLRQLVPRLRRRGVVVVQHGAGQGCQLCRGGGRVGVAWRRVKTGTACTACMHSSRGAKREARRAQGSHARLKAAARRPATHPPSRLARACC